MRLLGTTRRREAWRRARLPLRLAARQLSHQRIHLSRAIQSFRTGFIGSSRSPRTGQGRPQLGTTASDAERSCTSACAARRGQRVCCGMQRKQHVRTRRGCHTRRWGRPRLHSLPGPPRREPVRPGAAGRHGRLQRPEVRGGVSGWKLRARLPVCVHPWRGVDEYDVDNRFREERGAIRIHNHIHLSAPAPAPV